MPNISLARVDGRMIHGVVIANWCPACGADIIVAVDDITASDDFLVSMMKSCALKVDCEVLTSQAFADWCKEEKFGNKNVFVVFKSVDMAYKTIKAGADIKELQLGYTLPSADKTIEINQKLVMVSPKDVEELRELNKDYNVEIYSQYHPQNPAVPYKKWEV